ncbi:GIY-YIG nuclease family protein [Shewanella sp. N2AIL]|uniref:GIY-YIG nuclease family protein n=1 Tax=Shewanella sp. N2AIL TaxID=2926851 RepID=UPI001F59DEB8|nr:GIY-YIG nuclease family protein [Shewanella sp. N2AIL]MCI2964732.1 GIY-YIG nuclease family protein [Shewanella sp. N2AIL]
MIHYIYHIRFKEHDHDVNYGYIGLTNNPSRRKAEHWAWLAINAHKNHKLQKAFNEREHDLDLVIYKSFETREHAAILEESLRPCKNIGWNIAVGGEKSFAERFDDKKFNIESELVDHRQLNNKFNFSNERFSLNKKVFRSIFRPLINRWRVANQATVLQNLLLLQPHLKSIDVAKLSNELICKAWIEQPCIFLGKWGAVPHDSISAAFALILALKDKTLPRDLRLHLLISSGYFVEEFLVNGRLYGFNYVDAFFIEQILENYFYFKFQDGTLLDNELI